MDILPPASVRRRLDVFRCDPYHANITAQTCLLRQRRLAAGDDPELARRGHEGGDYGHCTESCAAGATIRENVKLPEANTGMAGGMAKARSLPPVAFSRGFLARKPIENAADPTALLAPENKPIEASPGPMPKPALKMGKRRK